MTNFRVYPDSERLADAAADHFVEQARQAIAARGRFAVALAGGSTPRAMLTRLAQSPRREQVDWGRVHVFWGDERCVPPDTDASNYRMAADALLAHVAIPANNIHRLRGEERPALAALAYEEDLRAFFRTPDWPTFDLVLLGLGENGHTASLFPGGHALCADRRWSVAQYVEIIGMWRLTLTPPVINHAAQVTFLVSGASKAHIVYAVTRGPYAPEVLPAQLVQPPTGHLLWLLDKVAAVEVQEGP